MGITGIGDGVSVVRVEWQFCNPLCVAVVDMDASLADCFHLEYALAVFLLAHLEGTAPRRRDDDHAALLVVAVHGAADIGEIFVRDVVVAAHLLVLQELALDLLVHFLDAGVELLLGVGLLLEGAFEFCDFAFDLGVLVAADPADGVLLDLLDVVDAFQHVGDVVDAPFLHPQHLHRHVQVDRRVLAAPDQVDELLRQHGQRVVLSAATALRPAAAGGEGFVVWSLLLGCADALLDGSSLHELYYNQLAPIPTATAFLQTFSKLHLLPTPYPYRFVLSNPQNQLHTSRQVGPTGHICDCLVEHTGRGSVVGFGGRRGLCAEGGEEDVDGSHADGDAHEDADELSELVLPAHYYQQVCMAVCGDSIMMEATLCHLCGLQFPHPATLSADLPIYVAQSDSIRLASKRLCKSCHIILAQIQSFVTHTKAQYCSPHFRSPIFDRHDPKPTLPRRALELAFATTPQPRNRSQSDNRVQLRGRFSQTEGEEEEPLHPYLFLVVEELRGKGLLSLAQLPKTLQYLVVLTSRSEGREVAAEERHEKVKGLALVLAERLHLSVDELPHVMLLAHFLLCLMDPARAAIVLTQLSHIILTHPQLLSWKTLIIEQSRLLSQTPLSPATLDLRTVLLRVDKLWPKLEAVLELGSHEQSLREGLIRLGQIDPTVEWKDYCRKVAEGLKSGEKTRRAEGDKTKTKEGKQGKDKKQGKERKDGQAEQGLALLYQLKQERNGLSLIMRQLFEQEEHVRQQLAEQANKFRKEKDEFINKIVSLTQKVESLQSQLAEKTQICLDHPNGLTNSKQASNDIAPNPPPEPTEQVYEPVHQASPIDNSETSVNLQNILTLTDLFAFNDRHLGESTDRDITTPTTLASSIVAEVQRLQTAYERSQHKLHTAEEEKSRLLGILGRKEDRLIGVITEKDVIIERYEQALWKMENGLEVTEQPLAHRIRYIMHIFSSRQPRPSPSSQSPPPRDCEIF